MLKNLVLGLDPGEITFAFLALVVFSVWAAWRAYKNIAHARTMEDHPTSKARSAHQGYVELQGTGKLLDEQPIVAPCSGIPCIWFRYKIEKIHDKGDTTVAEGTSADTFLLEDDTGQVVIDPEGAEVLPLETRTWYANRPDMTYGSSESRRFAARLGVLGMGGTRYRYTEAYLFPNRTVYAIGYLKNLQSHISGPSLRERVGALLREWKANREELHARFDLDGDGRIDEQEWMLARRQAHREAQKERQEEMRKYNDGLNVMMRPADRQRPYIISGLAPEKLIRKYRLTAVLLILGFFGSGSLALYIFNMRLIAMIGGKGGL